MRIQNWLLTALGIVAIFFLTACSSDSEQAKKFEEPVLLISFDGFRYDYLSKTDTPHFDSLAASGVQSKALIPIFPTKTFPAHYAIATGLYPENSGLIDNTMYDPEMDQWYRIRDREAVENSNWYKGEPIWNTVEKQGGKAGTMFWIGSEAPIQDIRPTHWKTYDGSMPETARIDTVVKWFTPGDEQEIDFGTLYFEHVDTQGHRFGTDSDSLITAIERADEWIGYLKQRMKEEGLWENTNILIVSDHGMINQSADKTIRLDNIIDTDSAGRIVWGPVTRIQPKEGELKAMYEQLKENEQNYRVFKKEEMPDRFHYRNSNRIEDLIIIADLGYTLLDADREENFLESLPAAAHGYDNNERLMHSIFIARGPAFKERETVPPFQSVHLYELMNELLGTRPAPNDGSPDSVKILLK